MKKQKQILAKLMGLNNPQADKYLADFADEAKRKVLTSEDNDEILEILNLLEEFVYKVPKQTIEIAEHIINTPHQPKQIDIPGGSYEGKEHKEVVAKVLDLLREIRYIHADAVLPILASLVREGKPEFKSGALEVLKRFSKYDFNVLTKSKMGYGPQRKVLDFILGWSLEEKLANFDFIEVAARELLSSSIEGTTAEAMDTLTFHFAAIQPTDFIKKLRREVMDLIMDLYGNTPDETLKLKLAKVLEEATHGPGNVVLDDEFMKMLSDDANYLLGIYKKMLFDEKGGLVGSIAVAEEIERRLYWFHKNSKFDVAEVRKLREAILNDSFYSLFRLFAGDEIVFREEEGWNEAEAKRGARVDAKVEELSLDNVEGWEPKLNLIAAEVGPVEEWKFSYFKRFLRKLSVQKSEVADKILESAIKNGRPLKIFIASFLDGFREVNRLDLWEKYVKLIAEQKDSSLVSGVCISLNLDKEVDVTQKNRKEDIDILENIVLRKNEFAFLQDSEKNHFLHYTLINALARNYACDPERVEGLIIEEMRSNPAHAQTFYRELPFLVWRGWMDVSKWSKPGIQFLLERMVNAPDLDWDLQGLLLDIGKNDFKLIMDVFLGRIQKAATRERKRKGLFLDKEHYEAIPYHFNPDLRNHIVDHSEFPRIVGGWIEKMNLEWSIYNWEISNFLDRISAPLVNVLEPLIEAGGDKNLMRAVRALDTFDAADLELCMKIVARTDNKKILDKLAARMFATGVVSGEDGIALAYEAKAEALKAYLTNENEGVRKFAERTIKSLQQEAINQRQRSEEDRALRKARFEG